MLERSQQLFSYVVDHDYGLSPNPEGGLCSLARCKYGTPQRANLVEKAMVGDWLIGTVGKSNIKDDSQIVLGGLLYAMKITEKITLKEYVARYPHRRDAQFQSGCDRENLNGRFALLSNIYFYFGKQAINLDELPRYDAHPISKKGPGYRRDFDEDYVQQLEAWFLAQYQIGQIGKPCLVIKK